MTKKIACQTKIKNNSENVRVKVIKAPFVDTAELRKVLFARARALVL
jgi:hypothetical protein